MKKIIIHRSSLHGSKFYYKLVRPLLSIIDRMQDQAHNITVSSIHKSQSTILYP